MSELRVAISLNLSDDVQAFAGNDPVNTSHHGDFATEVCNHTMVSTKTISCSTSLESRPAHPTPLVNFDGTIDSAIP